MTAVKPLPTQKAATDPRRTHRRVVVFGGALAIAGAALAAFVDPVWVSLAAAGGLLLLLYPDRRA